MEWVPRTLEEFGLYNQTLVICQNYMESVKRGKPIARGILLYGRAGTGKTTLVRLLAREYGWALVETNASLDHTPTTFRNLTDSVLNRPLSGDHKVFFFDESDNMNASAQASLKKIIDLAKDPVFLACNDITSIGDNLKKTVLNVYMAPPSKKDLSRVAAQVTSTPSTDVPVEVKSYRALMSFLETGKVVEQEDDPSERIKMILRGEKAHLNPGEYWMIPPWILDNTQGAEALMFDLQRGRYQKVGKIMEKYLLLSLELRLKKVEFPWSIALKAEKKKEPEVPKAPQGLEVFF